MKAKSASIQRMREWLMITAPIIARDTEDAEILDWFRRCIENYLGGPCFPAGHFESALEIWMDYALLEETM